MGFRIEIIIPNKYFQSGGHKFNNNKKIDKIKCSFNPRGPYNRPNKIQ